MRLIDADKIEPHEQLTCFGNGQAEFVMVAYMDDIDALPTVDAVEVVRCRDCKRWDKYHNEQFGECKWTFRVTKAEGYCNYGEWKDGDHHDNNH